MSYITIWPFNGIKIGVVATMGVPYNIIAYPIFVPSTVFADCHPSEVRAHV
jgi:hypothetical protein